MAKSNSCPRNTRYRRSGGRKGARCLKTKKAALAAKRRSGGTIRVVKGKNRGDVIATRKRMSRKQRTNAAIMEAAYGRHRR